MKAHCHSLYSIRNIYERTMHNFICTACIVLVRLLATCITFALVEKQVGAAKRILSFFTE
jgi:hypothetical protein